MTNFYNLLEIPITATDDEVRKAVRDQRKRWSQLQGHPKLEVQHEAQLKVRELTDAEAVLTNPDRRREYDASIRPPTPVPTYDRAPNPTPVLDRRPAPSPQPWQMDPEPWSPKPSKPLLLSAQAMRWLLVVAGMTAALVGAVWFVAPAIGASIRSATGNFPGMAEESYDGSFDYIVTSTDRLVGSAVLFGVLALLVALVLLRWKKLVSAVVLIVGIVGSGALGVTATSAYAGEARELIMDGMCNGGQGSTGHTELDGKRVEYGLNRSCDALALWSGTSEIRTISSPANRELDLHVVGTASHDGGYYVAAATMATDQGGPYTLVTFRIDKEEQPQPHKLRAPDRGQGFPILGRNALFQFERQASGQGMVTALNPDTGNFVWDVKCPAGWEFLGFAYDGMIDNNGDTMTCVQQAENRLRTYLLDTERGRLGELIEDRAWSR